MIEADGIPEAWPALLSFKQLRAYLGDLGEGTVRAICPVAPIELGVSVARYRKMDVDAWLSRLAQRQLQKPAQAAQSAADPDAANEGGDPSLARAKARAGK